MSEYLSSVVGSGTKYGVRVVVSEDKEPLGTCGPLTLVTDHLTEPYWTVEFIILAGNEEMRADQRARRHQRVRTS